MLITREELARHSIRAEKTFEPGALDFQTKDLRQTEPLHSRVRAELVAEEIHVRGSLSTKMEAACDRCAVRFDFPVECDFDLFYRPVASIARNEEIEVSAGELEIGFYEGEGVELADVVREQVLLSLPMKMLCEPDCRGVCPMCGANRNRTVCQCQNLRLDSPFAALMPGPDRK